MALVKTGKISEGWFALVNLLGLTIIPKPSGSLLPCPEWRLHESSLN